MLGRLSIDDPRGAAAIAAAAFVVFAISCEPDDPEPDADDADSGGPEDTVSDADIEVGGELPDDFMFASEYEMRFTSFKFTDSSPGTVANNVISRYLDQSRKFPLVVLLRLEDLDPSAGTAMLRGGAGLKVDKKCIPNDTRECRYQWDPKSSFQGSAGPGSGSFENCADEIGEGKLPENVSMDAGDSGSMGDADSGLDAGDIGMDVAEPDTSDAGTIDPDSQYTEIALDSETGELRGGLARLNFVGTTEFQDGTIKKFILPIRQIVFRDAYLRPTDDGEVVIQRGRIRGYITIEDARTTKVQIQSGADPVAISQLLTKEPNYDSDDDGVRDSWCMEGRFSAGETEIVEQ